MNTLPGFKKLGLILTVVALWSLAFLPHTFVQAQEKIKIGVLQYVDHEALNAVLEGFQETLNNSAYKDRIEWDINNAAADQSALQSMSEKLARDNDILFAIATPAAQALATVEQEKPIFIAAVTDPVEAGLVKSLEKPESNITGTSDMAPIEKQVALLTSNFPDAKTIGIIYNSSEVNSLIQVEAAQKILEDAGLTVETATVTSTNDIAQQMTALIDKVDAMFLVTDNTIDSAISLVGDIAKKAKIPLVGSSDSVIKKNGLMTLSNAYKDYGIQTAKMVIDMLDNDLKVANMPVQLGENFEVVTNEEFAKAIGFDLGKVIVP